MFVYFNLFYPINNVAIAVLDTNILVDVKRTLYSFLESFRSYNSNTFVL
jgi:hypothetical protein